jgi:hypothetical protein
MRLAAIASSLLLSAATLAAAPLAAPVRAEVDTLLDALQNSGCRFNRNGTWYDGRKAKEHLLEKLDYLERRGTVASTERFIDLAASTSSMSGKPYLVQCGAAAAVESRAWLTSTLQSIRAGGAASAPAR